jgi:methylmalonyl-CoA mutase cobalamin-binding subunit
MTPRIRVVITDSGIATDGPTAEGFARGLRDAGLEVVFVGTGLSAAQLVATLIQEDADALVICGRSGPVADALGPLEDVKIFTSGATVDSVLEWSRSARAGAGPTEGP